MTVLAAATVAIFGNEIIIIGLDTSFHSFLRAWQKITLNKIRVKGQIDARPAALSGRATKRILEATNHSGALNLLGSNY